MPEEKSGSLAVLSVETTMNTAEAVEEYLRASFQREPVEWSRPGSEHARIEVYFDRGNEAILAGELLRARFPEVRITLRPCREEDWATWWRRHFKPHAVGRRLLICPAWDRERVDAKGRCVILIHPGLSFGTGDHFTTRFCLEMIDHLCEIEQPDSLLDVGCGSGILAITAARLGVPRVTGIDNDPESIRQSRHNAIRNGVGDRIDWREGSLVDTLPNNPPGPKHEAPSTKHVPPNTRGSGPNNESHITNNHGNRHAKAQKQGGYHIVCANLYASLLIDGAPGLARASSRHLVLSGIQTAETDAVADAFVPLGFHERVRYGDAEWSGLLMEKRC